MLFSRRDVDPTRASRPLPRSFVALGALVAGFILARALPPVPSATAFAIAGTLSACALILQGKLCKSALTFAAVALGFAYFSLRIHEHSPSWVGASAPGVMKVQGVIRDTPRSWTIEKTPLSPHILDNRRAGFDLAVSAIITETGPESARGTLWVRIAGGLESFRLHAGDRVQITGLFEPHSQALNPGERDRRQWGIQDGRAGYLRLPRITLVEPIAPEGFTQQLESKFLRTRALFADRAHTILLGDTDKPDPGRALLGALVLGDDDRALREVRSSFNRLGLAHILTISGFHLTVMTGVILVGLRAWRDLGPFEPLIAAALILIYLAILPFNAPVWRSGLMILGLLAADACGRRYDRLAILGWIAFAIVLYRPLEAWSIGFQLSFGLVALLVWIAEFVHGRIFGIQLKGLIPQPSRGILGWLLDSTKRLTSTSLLCGIAATPVVAYHTGLVSPVAVLTSIILVPPITLLLIAAYIVLFLGVMAPPAAPAAADALSTLSTWTASAVSWIDTLPGTSLDVPRISLPLTLAATIVILYFFIRARFRDAIAWILFTAISAWTIAEFRLASALPRSTLLRIDTLAVGDGTCHLIRSGRDAMLWDCGSLTPGIGERTIPRALHALGARSIPTILITHPNLDHFNGILDVAAPLGLQQVITGRAVINRATQRPASAEAFLLHELKSRGIQIHTVDAGDSITLGDCTIEFISPARSMTWSTDNDASLVARIISRDQPDAIPAALLTGDIQGAAIDTITREHPELRARIVEAPHHGSPRKVAVTFVASLGPQVVLQSTGPDRAGDPAWTTIRRNSAFYCTATNGAAWALVKKDGSIRSGALHPN